MNHREKIGCQIQDIRVQKGLTKYELAEMVGITHQNIDKIEQGRYNVGVDLLDRICKALGAEIKIE